MDGGIMIEIKITITEESDGCIQTHVSAHSIGTLRESMMGQAMARTCAHVAEWIAKKVGQPEGVIVEDKIEIIPLEDEK